MPAYFIGISKMEDEAKYNAEYVPGAVPSIFAHGGKIVVATNDSEDVEGEHKLTRTVILEFPDMESAKKWYNCDEYQAVLPKRLATTSKEGFSFFVKGFQLPGAAG
jgi:uncharacterized protein (DUF1330 family)